MNKPFMIIVVVASLLLLGAVAVVSAGEPASPPYGATVTTIEAELPTCSASTVIQLTLEWVGNSTWRIKWKE